MRILIVTQYFWPENFRINDLALELKSRGHSVTVLTGIPNYPQGVFYPEYSLFRPFRQQYEGINIIRAPLLPRGKNKPWQLVLNYLSFAFFASLTGALFCRKRYDNIFVYEPSPILVGIPAIVIKRITGSPIFFWVQDIWPDSLVATNAVHSSLILSLVNKLVTCIYNNCDRVLVTSKGFTEKIIAQGQQKEKLSYFPQWVEEIFSQNVDLKNHDKKKKEFPKGFNVLFTGNIGVAQSIDSVVDAAQTLIHYPEINLIFIGEGRKKSWFQSEVNKRNLENTVYFIGSKPLEDMPAYCSVADALLVTLKKDPVFSLTVPAKIQSYLASGKPIIAALDGEGRKIIDVSKSGLTSRADSSPELSENIIKMYQLSHDERARMGLNGKTFSDKFFNRKKLIDKLEEDMQAFSKGSEHA